MLEYLIDNIFVDFGGRTFQQTVGIPMGTNCAPLLADLFLYSYEAEFVQSLLQANKKHLAQQFNYTYRYIDDVLSLKNTKLAEYLEFIYPSELEIKETTETAASSSNLDCYLYIDNGKLTTRLYDKRDDFNFPTVNFPFLSSNIPSAPAYGVYVSQLIRYARPYSNYQDFMERGKVLTTKLLRQGYQKTKLVATHEVLWETSWSGQSLQCGSFQNCFWCFCQWRAICRLPKSRTYASTDISFVQAYGHGGRSLITK